MSDETAYQPIACALHDLLEIACLRGHPVLLELRGQESISCRPLTTISGLRSAEWLKVEREDGSQQEIRLDQILVMTPADGPERGRHMVLSAD